MKRQHLIAIVLIAALFSFVSCSFSMTATLRSDQQIEVSYSGAIKPKMAELLKGFNSASGAKNSLLISAASVSASLQKISELSRISVKETDAQALAGSLWITDPEKLSRRFSFISQKLGSGESVLTFTVSRESAPQLLSLFTQDVRDYLDALMAPVLSGEKLTNAEYLALVTSVYGKTIAQEIESSRLALDIQVPGKITKVIGGTAAESRASFSIPLLDLLVLQKTLNYQVVWN
ncbi:hypothetical protein [Gracilinema caldarium]|uniref:hypothetical protein n=1 Tax=Gracilinema caldarium TaxID=215591 RepID=UPI0026ECD9A3|nr:hypothetical protein [Gracilinema caldarium]